jgi:hypothetical protein
MNRWMWWFGACTKCDAKPGVRRLAFERLDTRDLLTLMIDGGVHYLLPDQAQQAVPVLVSRDEPDYDPLVTGFNLRAELRDGSVGGITPVFQAIHFDGGIWDGLPTTVTGGPVVGAERFAQASVVFNRQGDSTVPEGRVATLVISTVGIQQGSYQLRLADSEIGADSDFIGLQAAAIPAAITVGRIQVSSRPWQNPHNPLDVNADTLVTPLDALIVINDLNAYGIRELPMPPIPPDRPPPYLDVSGDGYSRPLDVLLVINFLNQQAAGISAMPVLPLTASPSAESVAAGGESSPARTPDDVRQAHPVAAPQPWTRLQPSVAPPQLSRVTSSSRPEKEHEPTDDNDPSPDMMDWLLIGIRLLEPIV